MIPTAASRPPAPQVAPVEFEGVRYVQDQIGPEDPNGGFLAAIDIASGKKLWRLQVYEVEVAPSAPIQSLGRYFRSMVLRPDGRTLEIEDEVGGKYIVDLASRTAVQVDGPPATPAPAAPGKPKPTFD